MVNSYKSFFSLFNYPKEDVLRVVETLKDFERELLYKKYGKDLMNTEFVLNLTEKENETINQRIIRKIRLRLKELEEDLRIVSLTEVFLGETFEDIKEAIEKSGTLSYYQKKFGKDLKGSCCISKKEDSKKSVNRKMKLPVEEKLKEKKGLKRVKLIRPFFSLFEKYKRSDETYEEYESRVRTIVDGLNDKLKKSLYHIYNEDLLNIIQVGSMPREIRINFSQSYGNIVNTLERQNRKYYGINKIKRYNLILNLFCSGTTLDRVREEIKKNPIVYELSKKKYGEDLSSTSEINSLTRKENQKLYDFYSKLNKRFIRENRFRILNEIKDFVKSDIYMSYSKVYGEKDALGLLMYLNYSEFFSLEEISNITNVSLETLFETINKYGIEGKGLVLKHGGYL